MIHFHGEHFCGPYQKRHQSRIYATLRDTLQPKLLSGELSVTDAEEGVHNPTRQIV